MVAREFPALMDDIIKAGARAIVTASLRTPRRAAAPIDFEAEKARKQAMEDTVADAARTIVQRVEVGSAVVEMLDGMIINGKRLGDCTRRELLTEAETMDGRATALTSYAGWLRRLAEIVRPNETLRIADRKAVVAVLQERAASRETTQ